MSFCILITQSDRQRKIVSATSGNPKAFDTRRKAKQYIHNHYLIHSGRSVEIITEVEASLYPRRDVR